MREMLMPQDTCGCHETYFGVIRHALVSSDMLWCHQTCMGASRGLGSVQHAHLLRHVHASWRSLAGAVCGQQGALHPAPQSPAAPFRGRPGYCREWREPAAAGNLAGQFLGLQTCQSRYDHLKHGIHPCWRGGQSALCCLGCVMMNDDLCCYRVFAVAMCQSC